MRRYALAVEPWSAAWWAEARPLAEAHAHEVDDGIEPRRRFKLDERQMALGAEAGVIKLATCRAADGRMAGYFTWQVQMDVESEGLLVAHQGGWYAEPECWGAALQLWDYSVAFLKRLRVQNLFVHHRTQGRGSHLGRFFERQGAKKIQTTYSLWIGD